MAQIVYKKVRILKNGECYPLFIDKRRSFKFGSWMKAEFHPTNGFAPRSLGKDANGEEIGGWHCCFKPEAPHLADVLSSGEKRVWIKCEAKGIEHKYSRPEGQGGAWLLVAWLKPLEIVA